METQQILGKVYRTSSVIIATCLFLICWFFGWETEMIIMVLAYSLVISAPAVISLNGAVASVAITTFLSAMAALPSEARMIHYDAIRGSMRPTIMSPTPGCVVCSPQGALARGATWSLPTRNP